MTTVLTEKLFFFFRMYNTLYEDRQQPHFTYFGKLFKKIEIYGTFVSKSRKRANTITEENNSFLILASFYENPYTSLRSISGNKFVFESYFFTLFTIL